MRVGIGVGEPNLLRPNAPKVAQRRRDPEITSCARAPNVIFNNLSIFLQRAPRTPRRIVGTRIRDDNDP